MTKKSAVFGLLVFVAASFTVGAATTEWHEHSGSGYFRLLDASGEQVTCTGLRVNPGDIYIAGNNDRYVVEHVEGNMAYVRGDGREEMPQIYDETERRGAVSLLQWISARIGGGTAANRKTVGIYHTHSAESYKPTSGTESKSPRGDVYAVGETLASALEQAGIKVEHSWDTFLPHDGQAYVRSRRTAAQLSQGRPQTIIDVHRDAIPDPAEYLVTINGEEMSKIRLVVGRQNQNRGTNFEYAKRIKAVADEKYPGLIHGIFSAAGNYNQDIGPRMILMEFGTHTTSLEAAKRSAVLMSKVLPVAAGLAPGTEGIEARQMGGAATSTLAWIVGLAVAGVIAWVWLNKEGLRRHVGGDPQTGSALGAEEDEKIDNLSRGSIGAYYKRRLRRFGRRRR